MRVPGKLRLFILLFVLFAFSAVSRGGFAAEFGVRAGHVLGAWPAQLSQLPDPKEFGAVGWLIVGIVGLLGMVGTVAGVAVVCMNLVEKIRGRKEEPREIKQPIRFQRESVFVPMEAFSDEMKKFDVRCMRMESQIRDHVLATEKYLHEFRHELRGDVQLITSQGEERSVKLHDRINQVLLAVGQLQGRAETRK